MKFSEMPYVRPDLDALQALTNETVAKMDAATSAAEQLEALKAYEKAYSSVYTVSTLAYVRHTINTKDEFYEGEQNWMDEAMPRMQAIEQQINQALLRSPYRDGLAEKLGSILFTNLEIAVRAFKPELMELMMEENKLTSEYQKLLAGAMVEFDGQTLPLTKLTPYQTGTDRAVRKAAYETAGNFYDAHQAELDEIFDKLVKNRTAQAKLLGHENYLALGYDRLGRNCYGPEKVAAFREQIANDMVPIVAKVKEHQKARLGLDHMYFYDDGLLFPDGNAKPQGTADDILAAGKEMYHNLSAETAEFIDFMYENELLDVLSKEGKAPGGYCCGFTDYNAPFIYSNFNGTDGDVDVLTHEAGHAFAAFRAFRKDYPLQLLNPTMEACECHSMSMEFLTQDYHNLFFGPATRKYEVGHCEDALIFIPYGCMVDEFQHKVYENPDLTPAERNELWLSLEKKYRPWMDFGDLPFYSRGALWQRQMHIYQNPFYYIDYCMAQTVAFQFWILSMENREDAWQRYLTFVDKAGTCTFEELVQSAGLKLPYDAGCIKEIGEAISKWIDENPLN